MHSIKTKITVVAASAIVVTMIIAAAFGVIAIKDIGTESADKQLTLLCQTGQKNLDSYFNDVILSVGTVSAYVEDDLDGLDDEHLQAHLDRADELFKKLEYNNAILTYYYRIDPEVSENAKGFWYVRGDDGFTEHEVTDITQYDTSDTSQLVWFTVPKATGKPVWLPPYITDNLGARVLSYNAPVYYEGKFVGVIGIELDYSMLAKLVDNITLYENGYAFIDDPDRTIIYHPHMDIPTLEKHPKVPEEMIGQQGVFTYEYEGVKKKAVCLPLRNGALLNVAVPVSEINAVWYSWIKNIIFIFLALLIVLILLISRWTRQITKPLSDLTAVAEQVDAGDYDARMEYDGDDEIGVLSKTFNKLTAHLGSYISDLNDLAYADALTSLHNKGAFDITINNMQTDIREHVNRKIEFAVCIFDCNDLKSVNDVNGHDKGDIYLKETAAIICEVYKHSPVFRVGGDEFAALLLNRDYRNRDELLRLFDEKCAEKRKDARRAWEKVSVARGMAVYDPEEDESVNDVVRRADKLMYENKWNIKGRVRGE